MPNPIKYTIGSETDALKKGNFYIGTGSVEKGPTSSTGYYNGITPQSGGYTIYLNKETGGPSIYTASNDAQLISLTNSIAVQNYTTIQECFNYFYSQNDKLLVNQDYPVNYPYIVMDGLVLNLDAGITQSYPTTGTTWTDINGLGPRNNGTLTNGPTFNSANGGSIVFDGIDDFVTCGNPASLRFNNATFSYGCWFYWNNINIIAALIGKRDGGSSNFNQYGLSISQTMCCGPAGKRIGSYLSCDGGSVQGGNLITDLPNSEGWIYAFITVNTTEQRLYLNGDLKVTTTQDFTNQTFNIVGRSFYVGATGGNTEGPIIVPFNNKIAVAQAYNRTLTAQEVLQNYNATKSRYGL
jgi:hypothetical protein